MYELAGDTTDWLTTIANAVEKVGTGAKDIQSVLQKKKQTSATGTGTGTGTVVADTIIGIPSWLVYSILGLLVVGGGAYLLLRNPSNK
jgi:hypothetical protein